MWEGHLLLLFSLAALPEHFSCGGWRAQFGSVSLISLAGVTLQTGQPYQDQVIVYSQSYQDQVVIYRLECAQD